MCGLAGFARHPNAPGLETAVDINRSLTIAAQSRGRHATGFAMLSPTDSFLKKWAIPMDALLEKGIYENEVESSVPDDVRYMIGHTRHATLANKSDDNAAHPFAFSRTVGCHNGTITNWREIQRNEQQDGWVTDSQAALWSIDQSDDPADALVKLDGWWALAWVKSGKLHLTRTEERPLAVAYSKKLKTLFWASLIEDLKKTLKAANVTAHTWELAADTVYVFDPKKFNAKAHPTKKKVKLDRPSARFATKKDRYQGELWKDSRRTWVDDVADKRRAKKGPRTMAQFMREIEDKVGVLEGRIESAEAEISFIYEVLDQYGALEHGIDSQCRECGRGPEEGELLRLPEGAFVHAHCVLR